MSYSKFSLVFILSLVSISVFAAPAQVLIIRHAEKPLGEEGTILSPLGFKRARALVKFFQTDPEVTRYGTPKAIYAMQPKDETGSVRSIQTVTPLAESLGMPVLSPYKKTELKGLVKTIMSNSDYNGKMVLICWEHKIIPDMAVEFGLKKRPADWPKEDFSTVYELNFRGSTVDNLKIFKQKVVVK